MKVLIIEDDERLAENIEFFLNKNSVETVRKSSGREGLESAKTNTSDVILLDWMLPDINGPEVARLIRDSLVKTPILFLTARSQIEDKVYGFESGADDYLTKPFNLQELLVRVKALSRRKSVDTEVELNKITIADLVIDKNKCEVKRAGKAISLSPKLFQLLEFLVNHKDKVMSRTEIVDNVWDQNADIFTNNVEVHIKNLRKQIDNSFKKKLIKTVRGQGYMICSD